LRFRTDSFLPGDKIKTKENEKMETKAIKQTQGTETTKLQEQKRKTF